MAVRADADAGRVRPTACQVSGVKWQVKAKGRLMPAVVGGAECEASGPEPEEITDGEQDWVV